MNNGYLAPVKFCAQQSKPGLTVETHRSEEKWPPPTPSLKMDLDEREWLAFLLQGTFSIAWKRVRTRTDASLLGDQWQMKLNSWSRLNQTLFGLKNSVHIVSVTQVHFGSYFLPRPYYGMRQAVSLKAWLKQMPWLFSLKNTVGGGTTSRFYTAGDLLDNSLKMWETHIKAIQ